jgi:arabinofuranosyltransferase
MIVVREKPQAGSAVAALWRPQFPPIAGVVPLALAAFAAVIGCWVHWRYGQSWPITSGHAWGTDDAYITYRYAWNLLNGWGPVFNPGEVRVEGYSNPLYLLAMTALMALVGPEGVYTASVALNTLALIATLPVLAGLAERLLPDQPALRAVVPLLGALFPPLWQAAATGLETVPVYALQLGLVAIAIAPPARRAALVAAAMAALLVAMRTDGFIVPLLVAVPLVLAGQRRVGLSILAATAGTFAALTAWRLTFYGLPLPNVVYVKVHGPILDRLHVAAVSALVVLPKTGIFPWLLLPLARVSALFKLAAAGRSHFAQPDVFLAGVPLVLIGYWLFIGGDVFFERFLLIAYPLGVLSLLAWLPRPRAVVAALLALNLIPFALDGRYAYAEKPYDMWIEAGRFLGERHPGAVLAIDAAGKVPYFSRLQTIDMLGLNDLHIAHVANYPFLQPGHNKRDALYVLGLRPDLIAAWRTKEFDVAWGMTRVRYLPAGYCPRYLVYSGRNRVAEPIIDLARVPGEQWAAIPPAWEFTVLERRADCPLQ